MKAFILAFFVFTTGIFAQTPDFSLTGFAAMEGGTTGGHTGDTVTPATFEELQNYATGNTPYIIVINREFKGPGVLRMGSNKTLLGIEDKGYINQIGVSIQCQNNIIIRNIKFTMIDVPITNDGENKIEGTSFDPDCIAIQADDDDIPEAQRKSHHIWIDHCEFYNEDPNVMTDYDRYDGLIDIKNDCQYITISWCYFHDHHKCTIIGKGSSDNFDRKTTFHHNYYVNIKSRMPLVRFGKCHFFNNYVLDCPDGNGINARINSNVYAEKNHFENVKKPVFGKLSEGGKVHLIDNAFINCSRLPEENIDPAYKTDPLSESETFEDSDWIPPYEYTTTLDSLADVPSIVKLWAGVNKVEGIIIKEPNTTSVSMPVTSQLLTFIDGRNLTVVVNEFCNIKIINIKGQLIYNVNMETKSQTFNLPNQGIYVIHSHLGVKKVVIK